MKDYINVQMILREAGVSAEIYPGEIIKKTNGVR